MEVRELLLRGELISSNTDYPIALEEYGVWCEDIKRWVQWNNFSSEEIRELSVKMHYVENPYSMEDNKRNLKNAVNEVSQWLRISENGVSGCFTKKMVYTILEKVITNFYMYYRAMYLDPVHGKGTLQEERLKEIKVGNEYDLQRMLYAILLPLFPTARTEVNSDNGYGGMRFDIFLDEYDVVIELKCTNEKMKEKKLTEELGADAFHYRTKTIFMFIYDKNSVIMNPAAFQKAFQREYEKDGKTVRAFVFQPVMI